MKAVETLFRSGAMGSETDGRLIARFLDGDAPADGFAALVDRHAPMILGVCRRILDDPNDADDAAQATFLVLARRARAIRHHDSLASWLFGVALRVAKRAKRDATRRREHERRKAEMIAIRAENAGDPAVMGIIDEEIARLPERLRGPIVACHLEGLTQEQAAARLNLPLRTIQRRLAQGRERLRARLARRGVAVPGDSGRSLVILPALRVEPSAAWLAETVRGAIGFASGGALAGEMLAAKVLADHILTGLTMTKLKMAAIFVFLGGIGLAGLIPIARGQKPPEVAKPTQRAAKPEPDERDMTLTVRDAKTKRPIADANVRVGQEGGSLTDAEGRAVIRFPVEEGRDFLAYVNQPGYVPTRIEWSGSSGAGHPPAYTLDLEPGTTIGGKVVDPDDEPIAGASVHLIVPMNRGSNPGTVADPAHSSVNLWDVAATTGPDGSWHHDEMPANLQQVLIRLDHPDFLSDVSFGSTPIPPIAQLRDRSAVMRMKKGLPVSGQVLDDGGNPVAGANVRQGETRSASYPATATDIEGRFRFAHAATGPMTLTVQAKGHAPEVRQIEVGAATPPVEFRLGPAAAIRGRVVDGQGKPVAGAWVVTDEWHGHRVLDLQTKTNADGTYLLDDAPPDLVKIQVAAAGFANSIENPAVAGEEAVITMSRPLKVSGRVLDAETGQPIPKVRIVMGQVGQPYWYDRDAKTFRDGRYVWNSTWPVPDQRVYKAKAEGYVPAISPPYSAVQGGTFTHDFRLTKGETPKRPEVAGVVRKADGSPAAGVTVHLATNSKGIYIRDGRPSEPTRHVKTETGPDGAFRFPPQEEAGVVLVLDDLGFAMAGEAALAEAKGITLAPWGRVEGEVRSGGGIVPRGRVQINPLGINEEDTRRVYFHTEATADDQGQFVIERAYPGKALISLNVPLGPHTNGVRRTARVVIPPGETVRVTVGGGGRTVAGRVEVPKGDGLRIDWSPRFTSTRFALPAPPVVQPPNMTPQERKVWYAAWSHSPAGIAYQTWQDDPRDQSVVLDADGAFRIEDVRPGTYLLEIQPRSPDRTGNLIGTARAVVVVPEIAEGDFKKPLDIGEVELKPAGP